MNLQASVSAFDCSNSPGPWINFEGAVTLAGLDVQLVFRNNINKDVHTRVEDVQTVVGVTTGVTIRIRSEEHTSELQSHSDLVCRLLLEKKKKKVYQIKI